MGPLGAPPIPLVFSSLSDSMEKVTTVSKQKILSRVPGRLSKLSICLQLGS